MPLDETAELIKRRIRYAAFNSIFDRLLLPVNNTARKVLEMHYEAPAE
jgi:hypothetical protein